MKSPAAGWPQAILFDLDGTLIDSAPDITEAVNVLLRRHAFEPLTLEAVRAMIGHGIGKLVERAFAARGRSLEGAVLAERTDEMMAIYGDHLTVLTKEMPGAGGLLAAAKAAGARTAIVTNKPEGFTRRIVEALGWSGMVDGVVGGDTGPPRKPAPDMLLHACAQIGVPPQDTVMVGDSPADIDAARAAAIRSIAVRGGYTEVPADDLGADTVVDSLEAVSAWLTGTAERRAI